MGKDLFEILQRGGISTIVLVLWMGSIFVLNHHQTYRFNYKHSFSIVLLAIVDADYKFLYVHIGCNGQISDGGVLKNCNIYRALEEKRLNVFAPTLLPGTQTLCPYVIVAYDAFPLKENVMKPYSQSGLTRDRVFNY